MGLFSRAKEFDCTNGLDSTREEARFHERASRVSQEIFPPGCSNKKPARSAGFILINSISSIDSEGGKETFDTEPKSYSIQYRVEPRSICTIAPCFWLSMMLRMIMWTLNDSNLLQPINQCRLFIWELVSPLMYNVGICTKYSDKPPLPTYRTSDQVNTK